jgi:hypothetical protein
MSSLVLSHVRGSDGPDVVWDVSGRNYTHVCHDIDNGDERNQVVYYESMNDEYLIQLIQILIYVLVRSRVPIHTR